jgi:hypothetical protein
MSDRRPLNRRFDSKTGWCLDFVPERENINKSPFPHELSCFCGKIFDIDPYDIYDLKKDLQVVMKHMQHCPSVLKEMDNRGTPRPDGLTEADLSSMLYTFYYQFISDTIMLCQLVWGKDCFGK